MSEAYQSAKAAMALHQFAVAKFLLFVIGTLCSSTLAALSGMEWKDATGQTKVMVIIGIGGSFCATVGAFLDSSIKRAAEGKDILTGLTPPIFATQTQVDAGKSDKTMVSPATLAQHENPKP